MVLFLSSRPPSILSLHLECCFPQLPDYLPCILAQPIALSTYYVPVEHTCTLSETLSLIMVCIPLMRSLQLGEKGSQLHTLNSRISLGFSGPQKGYAETATLPLGSLGAQGDRASRKGI